MFHHNGQALQRPSLLSGGTSFNDIDTVRFAWPSSAASPLTVHSFAVIAIMLPPLKVSVARKGARSNVIRRAHIPRKNLGPSWAGVDGAGD